MVVLQLSLGDMGHVQHLTPCFKTFTALKLQVYEDLKRAENQTDRFPVQMKSTLVAFPG